MDQADVPVLAHLLHEGAQPVAIIRSLMRYFQRLDLAQSYVQQGNNKDQAIKMLRPPVFYQSVDVIKQALSFWDASRISYCLTLLLRTEREIKSGTVPPALITSNAIVTIHGLRPGA